MAADSIFLFYARVNRELLASVITTVKHPLMKDIQKLSAVLHMFNLSLKLLDFDCADIMALTYQKCRQRLQGKH